MSTTPRSCSPHELQQALAAAGCQVVDVREPAEAAAERIAGTANAPLSALEAHLAGLSPERPTFLVCRSGRRAEEARQRLLRAGFTDLRVLDGGLASWKAAGLPLERGRGVWSLERQVRFAAGLLVVLGSVLGLAVSSAFVLLAAFVGAGLVFAAVTDTCGMAMMLARMPWNRRAAPPRASA